MAADGLEREPYGFLDAWLRYERAREHLVDVKKLIDAFETTPHEIGSHVEAEILKDLQAIEELRPRPHSDVLRRLPIPYEIPIRMGETVYNLRCSLDYLIFALAWHDSGNEPTGEWARRLQFPIESCIQRFERGRSTLLKGVSDPHVAMIRGYQPAEGCVWTAVLASLNDSDKHRHLSVLAGGLSTDAETTNWVTITPDIQAKEAAGMVVPFSEMDVETRATFDIVFPDGNLVSETLEELETEVRQLLLRFGREFKLLPL